MNNEQLKIRLLNVINTLDAMSLSGIENQRRLVACADYLKETIKMAEAQLVPLSNDAACAATSASDSAEGG